MTKLGVQTSGRLRGRHIAEAVTVAVVSATMFRFQQTGDPLVIVWGAVAILVLTASGTFARGLERGLSRLLKLGTADDSDGVEGDEHDAGEASEHVEGRVN